MFLYLKEKYESKQNKAWFNFEDEILSYAESLNTKPISQDCLTADRDYFHNHLIPIARVLNIFAWKTPFYERVEFVDKNKKNYDPNPVQFKGRKNSVAYKILELIAGNPEYFSEIITFNYTDLPSYIRNAMSEYYDYNRDRVQESMEQLKITPVHIETKNEHQYGVLGISDLSLIPQEYNFLRKSNQIASEKRDRVMQSMLEADELVIFGHSLGDSDADYFKPIFKDMFSEHPTHERKVTLITKNSNKDLLERITKLNDDNNIHIKSNFEQLKFVYTDSLESMWEWWDLSNAMCRHNIF